MSNIRQLPGRRSFPTTADQMAAAVDRYRDAYGLKMALLGLDQQRARLLREHAEALAEASGAACAAIEAGHVYEET